MGRPKKPKADNRADTRGGGWVGIPHIVVDSMAYQHLSLWGRAVLVEIARAFNGYNNGKIGLSQRQLAERLNTTNFRAIGRAVAELMEHGLIDVAAEGQWKQRMAREYRLTFVTTGDNYNLRAATNDYRDWTPRKSSDDDVSARGRVSADDVSAGAGKAADDVSAKIAAHQRKTANFQNGAADDVSSLIVKPYPSGAASDADGFQTAETPPENPLNARGPSVAKRNGPVPMVTKADVARFLAERGGPGQ